MLVLSASFIWNRHDTHVTTITAMNTTLILCCSMASGMLVLSASFICSRHGTHTTAMNAFYFLLMVQGASLHKEPRIVVYYNKYKQPPPHTTIPDVDTHLAPKVVGIWILASCQHTLTSERQFHHMQMHISKLFSYIKPLLKHSTKPDVLAPQKHPP